MVNLQNLRPRYLIPTIFGRPPDRLRTSRGRPWFGHTLPLLSPHPLLTRVPQRGQSPMPKSRWRRGRAAVTWRGTTFLPGGTGLFSDAGGVGPGASVSSAATVRVVSNASFARSASTLSRTSRASSRRGIICTAMPAAASVATRPAPLARSPAAARQNAACLTKAVSRIRAILNAVRTRCRRRRSLAR